MFRGGLVGPRGWAFRTLIGTKEGVANASTIKRQDAPQRWSREDALEMKGTPQQPDPGKPGTHIPTKIRLEPPVVMDIPVMKPASNEEGPRRSYLKKGFFQEHEYTVGCEGCSRLSVGMTKVVVHREGCRKRMYVELQKTDKGRKWLERAEDKSIWRPSSRSPRKRKGRNKVRVRRRCRVRHHRREKPLRVR